ncbi:MAG TPA: hypothetical protein VGG33_11375 [Polyangia bacterium]
MFWTTIATASTDSRLPEPSPVATGYSHTLFMHPDSKLRAWGDNSSGQIGIGSTTNQYNPIIVPLDNVVAMAAGDRFSIALNVYGALYTWGRNSDGQLGHNSLNATYTSPTQVTMTDPSSGIGWTQVAAGERHALGIRADGSLWAWGFNGSGQLGLGHKTTLRVPKRVGTANDWIAVAAGVAYSVAMRANGEILAAGSNQYGQLGVSSATIDRTTFGLVSGGHRYRAVSGGGMHVLAIRDDGVLMTWGRNDKGQLGDGSLTNRFAPGARVSGTWWRAVAAGYKHSLGITASGIRQGWGENTSGEAGVGNAFEANSPLAGANGTDEQYIAAGKSFGFAMKATGEMLMWGARGNGQLGMGTGTGNVITPARPYSASPLDGWATNVKPNQIAGGGSHSAAIRSNGQLETWGRNNDGQLGSSPSNTPSLAPGVRVSGDRWVSVAPGEAMTIALKASGTAWAWGGNAAGELGQGATGADNHTPQQVTGDNRYLKVTSHYSNAFALRADGGLWGWGDNTNAQIGDGVVDGNPRATPVQVGAGKRWVAVAVSGKNGYGITSDGKLWSWGQNSMGQLGNGQGGDNVAWAYAPIQVGTATNWVSVGAGALAVIARSADGKLWGFGANQAGSYQLGLTNDIIVTLPAHLQQATIFRDIAKGEQSGLAVAHNGVVKGWGYNSVYELGLGHNSAVAPATDTFMTPAKRIAIGVVQSFFISAGTGKRWGAGGNSYGEVGNNSQSMVPYHIPIANGW